MIKASGLIYELETQAGTGTCRWIDALETIKAIKRAHAQGGEAWANQAGQALMFPAGALNKALGYSWDQHEVSALGTIPATAISGVFIRTTEGTYKYFTNGEAQARIDQLEHNVPDDQQPAGTENRNEYYERHYAQNATESEGGRDIGQGYGHEFEAAIINRVAGIFEGFINAYRDRINHEKSRAVMVAAVQGAEHRFSRKIASDRGSIAIKGSHDILTRIPQRIQSEIEGDYRDWHVALPWVEDELEGMFRWRGRRPL